jgi:hypothetical protein
MEWCLLLLLVLLLTALKTIALLSPLAKLLAWALLLQLVLVLLLSIAALSLDESTLVLEAALSHLSDASRSLIEARNLLKKDMSLMNSNFGAFAKFPNLLVMESSKRGHQNPKSTYSSNAISSH